MKSTTRKSFVETFGEDQAYVIEAAAHSHMNSVHDNKGSDPFRWAICICIGHQCFEEENYREHHNITAPAEAIKAWIVENGDLANHDGDVDFLALFAGAYDPYIKHEEASNVN